MTPEKRAELIARRRQEQLKQAVLHFVQDHIQPCLWIIDRMRATQKDFTICEIVNVPMEQQSHLLDILKTLPYSSYALSEIFQNEDNPIINQLLKIHPTKNALRYVPDIPLVEELPSINWLLGQYQIPNQKVYFYHFRYALLYEIELDAFRHPEMMEIFEFEPEDTVIFPKDYSWLIAYSLENEWRFSDF